MSTTEVFLLLGFVVRMADTKTTEVPAGSAPVVAAGGPTTNTRVVMPAEPLPEDIDQQVDAVIFKLHPATNQAVKLLITGPRR